MSRYGHILVAIDVFNDHDFVLNRALALADADSKMSILYCVEPTVYPDAYTGHVSYEVQETVEKLATDKLRDLGKEHHLPESSQVVTVGHTPSQVHAFAKENAVDLIVIGSHGRHGVQLLLGSTANAVLHGATCDVLAVRLQ